VRSLQFALSESKLLFQVYWIFQILLPSKLQVMNNRVRRTFIIKNRHYGTLYHLEILTLFLLRTGLWHQQYQPDMRGKHWQEHGDREGYLYESKRSFGQVGFEGITVTMVHSEDKRSLWAIAPVKFLTNFSSLLNLTINFGNLWLSPINYPRYTVAATETATATVTATSEPYGHWMWFTTYRVTSNAGELGWT
jgi:hypothetical protein